MMLMRLAGLAIAIAGVVLVLIGWGTSASEPYATTVTLHRLFIKLGYIICGGFTALCGIILLTASAFLTDRRTGDAGDATDTKAGIQAD